MSKKIIFDTKMVKDKDQEILEKDVRQAETYYEHGQSPIFKSVRNNPTKVIPNFEYDKGGK